MKKINAILLVLLLVLSMTGCQLAKPEAESTNDRLVGILATREYLDLFDMEAYLNDNLKLTGGDIVIDGDTRDYQGRIYATFKGSTEDELQFSDLKGIHFVAARMNDNGEYYNRVYSNEGLLNAKTAYNYTDFEDSVSLEGEIWMVQTYGDLKVYLNPVYQDSDGHFYVTAGQGFHSSGDSVGGVYTQTLEESHTVTEGKKTTVLSNSIKISVGIKPKPTEYRLLQMRDDNTIADLAIYAPGEMPEEITVLEDTAYLLLETHQKNSNTIRDIFNPDADHISTLYAGEDGYLLEDLTFINWE